MVYYALVPSEVWDHKSNVELSTLPWFCTRLELTLNLSIKFKSAIIQMKTTGQYAVQGGSLILWIKSLRARSSTETAEQFSLVRMHVVQGVSNF